MFQVHTFAHGERILVNVNLVVSSFHINDDKFSTIVFRFDKGANLIFVQIMPHARLSSAEIDRRGQDLYDNRIRPIVETEDNRGKLIVIDVETGDYEIDTDQNSLAMSKRMHLKHPGAALIQFRIGYDAVVAFGGARLQASKR